METSESSDDKAPDPQGDDADASGDTSPATASELAAESSQETASPHSDASKLMASEDGSSKDVSGDLTFRGISPSIQLPVSGSFAMAPVMQKRGPGRPRKDGTVAVPRKKPPSVGRQRGRRKHFHFQTQPSQVEKSSLSPVPGTSTMVAYPSPTSVKVMESVILPMVVPEAKVEKMELGELGVDSDASLSSAVSMERLTAEEPPEQWPGKVCSFCNLGERSLLGQGDLTRFEPTAGFNPFKKITKSRRNSSESDQGAQLEKSPKIITWRRQRGPGKSGKSRKYITTSTDEEMKVPSPPVDELSVVGFAEEPDTSQLFEPSGHTFAHHCCAAWSESVCQTDEYVLVNVDKAVVTGMSQKCSNCHRYGATIVCKVPKCNKVYHYPCAASSGTFQDIKTMSLLCPQHLLQAPTVAQLEANCMVCEIPGDISKLLFCTSCGHHYHGDCLDPRVEVNAVVRAGWQCPECKICHTCRQPGDDNKMLMCDVCDKGYHTFCLKPAMTTIPKHGWKCKNCRICTDCNSHTPGSGPSSRWHRNYTVCDSCYQQRNKGLACPLCGRAYRHFTQKDMVQCTACRKYIHAKCDPEIDLSNIQQQREADLEPDYICPQCKSGKTRTDVAIAVTSTKDESLLSESSILTSSQDFGLSANEDSVCSMDIDLQAIERSAQQLQQLSGGAPFGFFDDFPQGSGKLQIPCKPMMSLGKFAGRGKRMGVGRPRGSSKFVAIRRRGKTADFGKRRGTKPKLKPGHFLISGTSFPSTQPLDIIPHHHTKHDDEPGMENKLVLCSASDEHVLSQDLCVMCGSFGREEEGRLIACSQCGQCYHPYCVSVKVTKVVLSKGWRCLDCTVCEGCGQPHDEGRLLLCDDCDISYHIYCLDPPLEQVPQGNWKCKWCVVCIQCGSTSPGFGSQWQNNYTQCGPCSSQLICPVCHIDYIEEDLIIQCIQCDRWLHAGCDQMNCEEDAEKAADYGYHCVMCRPKDQLPPHLIPPTPPPKPPEPPKPPTPPPKPVPVELPPKPQAQFFLDGVCLSESGMHQIKSLTIEQPKKIRTRKAKLQSGREGLLYDNSEEARIIAAVAADIPVEQLPEYEKMEVSVCTGEEDLPKDAPKPEDAPCEKKKRQRNLQKLGVGGFMARTRIRASFSKDQDKPPESTEIKPTPTDPLLSSTDGSLLSAALGAPEATSTPPEKPKRRRRMKKKSQLEDSYPAYLQEAFFGKDLLDTSKEQDTTLDTMMSDDDDVTPTRDKTIVLQEGERSAADEDLDASIDTNKDSPSKLNDDDLTDSEALKDILPLPQDLPQDDELVDMLMNEEDALSKPGEDLTDSETPSGPDGSTGKDDPLNDILDPNFNLEIVGETGLPQINSKEVEDLIKRVFPEDPHLGSPDRETTYTVAPSTMSQSSGLPGSVLGSVLQRPVQTTPQLSPFSLPPPSPYPSEYNSPQFSPGFSSSPTPAWPQQEAELESPSHNQRNILKWEVDESLGPQATISAVLYANINCPDLKKDYPVWSERAKQIAKIWRSLPSEARQPYLQKARENRAASRVQKAQQMKDSRQQAKSPKPPPQSEPTPLSPRRTPIPEKEQEKLMREQKTQRTQEQEKQWKQMQAIRHQQAQQQQLVLQEQRAQGPSCDANSQTQLPTPHPFAAMARVQHQLQSPSATGSMDSSESHAADNLPGRVVAASSTSAETFGRVAPSSLMTSTRVSDTYSQQPGTPHPSMLQDAVGQPRPALPGQLHISTTSQGQNIPQQGSPLSQQPSSGGRTFAPPIQVSRVRPPLDPTQMQVVSRAQGDSFGQPSNTLRPGPDSFVRPPVIGRSVSPQISRPQLRMQDPYSRPPFTPRPPSQPQDPYAQQPQTPKPQPLSDPYSQPPGTPLPQDPFHTPPQTPHPSTPDPFGQPSTPRPQVSDPYAQAPSTPHPATSQFSPTQTPRSLGEPYPKSTATPRPPLPPDPFTQTSTSRNVLPADPYATHPATPRPMQQPDPCALPSPRLPQDLYSKSPRVRPPLDVFSQATSRSLESLAQTSSSEAFQPSRPTPSPMQDPYAQPPGTPRPAQSPVVEQFPVVGEPLSLPEQMLQQRLAQNDPDQRTNIMARQHLRDLLQRQQIKRQLEQQIREQQGQIPLRHWSPGADIPDSNAHLAAAMLQQSPQQQQQLMAPDMIRSALQPGLRPGGPRPIGLDSGFRQPYPPGMRPRVLSPGVGLPGQPGPGMSPRQPGLSSPPGPTPGTPPQQMITRPLGQPLLGQQGMPGGPVPFRHPSQLLDPRMQGLASSDSRLRMSIMQQRVMQPGGQIRVPGTRFPGNNPLDPYDHLVQQQQQQRQPQSPVGTPPGSDAGARFGQPQLGQPSITQPGAQINPAMLGSPRTQSPQMHGPMTSLSSPMGLAQSPQMVSQQSLRPGTISSQGVVITAASSQAAMQSQEQLMSASLSRTSATSQSSPLPDLGGVVVGDGSDSVTEELEKLNAAVPESDMHKEDPDQEEDLELDDDELLGLGNDFNILEYADPELDKLVVGDGKKTNILDENLDLDDKDEELEDDDDKTKRDPSVKETELKSELIEEPHTPLPEGVKEEDMNKKGLGAGAMALGPSDFQAKFLEFSQRRDIEKAEELKEGDIFEEESLDSGINPKIENNEAKLSADMSLDHTVASSVNVHSSQSASLTSNFITPSSSITTMARTSGVPPSFTMPEAMKMQQGMLPGPRPVSGQFGQPPVSMPQSMASVTSQPPPYPGSGVPPPPPYQGSMRPQLPPGGFPNQAITSGTQLGATSASLAVRAGLQQQQRSLLLQEQPHLLEDLLQQEKEEQRRQQHQGLMSQSSDDTLLSDIDFEKLKADVLGTAGPPVSMSPGPAVPAQGMLPVSPLPGQSLGPQGMSPGLRLPMVRPEWQAQEGLPGLSFQQGGPPRARMPVPQGAVSSLMQGQRPPTQDPSVHPALLPGSRSSFSNLPPPPTPPAEPVTDADRQQTMQYEQWLLHTKQNLEVHQKMLEADVGKLRKAKKSLNTKQRQLRKNGQELLENDAIDLERITREQSILQKQLEQIRKQSRQHSVKIQDYQMKQQKRQQQLAMSSGSQQAIPHPAMMPMQHSPLGAVPSPMMTGPGTPQSPMLSPSPLGPSPSPMMQPPSPMIQSPLGPSPSPLMQHSPHGQVMYQQQSPRMGTPQPDQGRNSGLQVVQDDNNPFSESFQQRELRTQQRLLHPSLGQGEGAEVDDVQSSLQQLPFYREDSMAFAQNRPQRPVFSHEQSPSRMPSQILDQALRPRFPQVMGQRFGPRSASEFQQQQRFPTGIPPNTEMVGQPFPAGLRQRTALEASSFASQMNMQAARSPASYHLTHQAPSPGQHAVSSPCDIQQSSRDASPCSHSSTSSSSALKQASPAEHRGSPSSPRGGGRSYLTVSDTQRDFEQRDAGITGSSQDLLSEQGNRNYPDPSSSAPTLDQFAARLTQTMKCEQSIPRSSSYSGTSGGSSQESSQQSPCGGYIKGKKLEDTSYSFQSSSPHQLDYRNVKTEPVELKAGCNVGSLESRLHSDLESAFSRSSSQSAFQGPSSVHSLDQSRSSGNNSRSSGDYEPSPNHDNVHATSSPATMGTFASGQQSDNSSAREDSSDFKHSPRTEGSPFHCRDGSSNVGVLHNLSVESPNSQGNTRSIRSDGDSVGSSEHNTDTHQPFRGRDSSNYEKKIQIEGNVTPNNAGSPLVSGPASSLQNPPSVDDHSNSSRENPHHEGDGSPSNPLTPQEASASNRDNQFGRGGNSNNPGSSGDGGNENSGNASGNPVQGNGGYVNLQGGNGNPGYLHRGNSNTANPHEESGYPGNSRGGSGNPGHSHERPSNPSNLHGGSRNSGNQQDRNSSTENPQREHDNSENPHRGNQGIPNSGNGVPGNPHRGNNNPGNPHRGNNYPRNPHEGNHHEENVNLGNPHGGNNSQDGGNGNLGNPHGGRGNPGNPYGGIGRPRNPHGEIGNPENHHGQHGHPGNPQGQPGQPGNPHGGIDNPGNLHQGNGNPGNPHGGNSNPGNPPERNGNPGNPHGGLGNAGSSREGSGHPGNHFAGNRNLGYMHGGTRNSENLYGMSGSPGHLFGENGNPGNARGESGDPETRREGNENFGNPHGGNENPGNPHRGYGNPGNPHGGNPGNQQRGIGSEVFPHGGNGSGNREDNRNSGNLLGEDGNSVNQNQGDGNPGSLLGANLSPEESQYEGIGIGGDESIGNARRGREQSRNPGNLLEGNGNPHAGDSNPGNPQERNRFPGGNGNSGYSRGGNGNSRNPHGGNEIPGNPHGGNGNPGNPHGGNRNSGNHHGGDGNPGNPHDGNGNPGNPHGGNGNPGNPHGGNGNPGNPHGGNGNPGNPHGGNGNPGNPHGGNGNPGNPHGGNGNPHGGNGNPGNPHGGNPHGGNGNPGNPHVGNGNPGNPHGENASPGNPHGENASPGNPYRGSGNPGNPHRGSGNPGNPHGGNGNPGNPHGGNGNPGNPHGRNGNPGNPHNGNGNPGNPHSGNGNPGNPHGGNGNPGNPHGGNGNPGNPHGGNGNTGNPHGGNGNPGNPQRGNGNPGNPHGGNGNPGNPHGGNGNPGNPNGGNGNPSNPHGGNGHPGNPHGGNGNPGNPHGGNGNPGNPHGGNGNPGNPHGGNGNPNPHEGNRNPENPHGGNGNPGNPHGGNENPGNPHEGNGNPGNPHNGNGNPGSPHRGNGNPGSPHRGNGNPGNPHEGNRNTGNPHGANGNPGNLHGGNGTPGNPHGGNGNPGNPHGGNGNPGNLHGGNGNPGNPHGGNGNTGNPHGGNGNTGNPHGGNGNPGNPHGGNGNPGNPHGGNGNSGNPHGGNGNPHRGNGNPGNPHEGNGSPSNPHAGNGYTGNRNEGNGNPRNPNGGSWNPGNPHHGNQNSGNSNGGNGNPGNPHGRNGNLNNPHEESGNPGNPREEDGSPGNPQGGNGNPVNPHGGNGIPGNPHGGNRIPENPHGRDGNPGNPYGGNGNLGNSHGGNDNPGNSNEGSENPGNIGNPCGRNENSQNSPAGNGNPGSPHGGNGNVGNPHGGNSHPRNQHLVNVNQGNAPGGNGNPGNPHARHGSPTNPRGESENLGNPHARHGSPTNPRGESENLGNPYEGNGNSGNLNEENENPRDAYGENDDPETKHKVCESANLGTFEGSSEHDSDTSNCKFTSNPETGNNGSRNIAVNPLCIETVGEQGDNEENTLNKPQISGNVACLDLNTDEVTNDMAGAVCDGNSAGSLHGGNGGTSSGKNTSSNDPAKSNISASSHLSNLIGSSFGQIGSKSTRCSNVVNEVVPCLEGSDTPEVRKNLYAGSSDKSDNLEGSEFHDEKFESDIQGKAIKSSCSSDNTIAADARVDINSPFRNDSSFGRNVTTPLSSTASPSGSSPQSSSQSSVRTTLASLQFSQIGSEGSVGSFPPISRAQDNTSSASIGDKETGIQSQRNLQYTVKIERNVNEVSSCSETRSDHSNVQTVSTGESFDNVYLPSSTHTGDQPFLTANPAMSLARSLGNMAAMRTLASSQPSTFDHTVPLTSSICSSTFSSSFGTVSTQALAGSVPTSFTRVVPNSHTNIDENISAPVSSPSVHSFQSTNSSQMGLTSSADSIVNRNAANSMRTSPFSNIYQSSSCQYSTAATPQREGDSPSFVPNLPVSQPISVTRSAFPERQTGFSVTSSASGGMGPMQRYQIPVSSVQESSQVGSPALPMRMPNPNFPPRQMGQYGLPRTARMPVSSSVYASSLKSHSVPIGSPQVSYATAPSSVTSLRLSGPPPRMSVPYTQLGNPPVAMGSLGAQIGQPRVGYPQGSVAQLVGLSQSSPRMSLQQQFHHQQLAAGRPQGSTSPIGMPRLATSNQIGQPPLHHGGLSTTSVSKVDLPDANNMIPIGNPPVILPSTGIVYGQPPTSTMLRVSQVGLPHQIPSSVSSSCAMPVSSQNTQHSRMSNLPSPIMSRRKSDPLCSIGNVQVKTEVTGTSSCQMVIKQESNRQAMLEAALTGVRSTEKVEQVSMAHSSERSTTPARTPPSAGSAEMKEELMDDDRPHVSDPRFAKNEDTGDCAPQNALLKQLLQNNQPRKSTDENEHDPDETITLTQEQQRKLELIEKMPLTQEIDDGNADAKTKIRKMQEVEESQKGKRRQPQQKRQPKQPKSKDGAPPKKRPRKGSATKPEEDYDSYMESLMLQLRALPPIPIMEPDVPQSFNVCPAFGSGTLKPSDSKLKGSFGNATLGNQTDFYSIYPFGSNPPTPPASLPPTPPPHRGFYNQEFPPRYRDARRSIEVPASLPTPPPHADQRGQTPVGRDESPDTIVSSSSPEGFFPDTLHPFCALRLIRENEDDDGDDSKSMSPVIPFSTVIPIRVTALRPKLVDDRLKENLILEDEDSLSKDKENQGIGKDIRAEAMLLKSKLGIGPTMPLKDSGNVAVTLTLTSAAAEDIGRVLSSIADLLKIAVPPSYEIIERTATPPSQKLGLYKKGRDLSAIQSILDGGKPRFCRHCDVVVLSSGIRKKTAELPFLSKEDREEDEVIFCSTNCYMQFAITHRTTTEEKEAATVVDHVSDVVGTVRSKMVEGTKSEKPETPSPEEKAETPTPTEERKTSTPDSLATVQEEKEAVEEESSIKEKSEEETMEKVQEKAEEMEEEKKIDYDDNDEEMKLTDESLDDKSQDKEEKEPPLEPSPVEVAPVKESLVESPKSEEPKPCPKVRKHASSEEIPSQEPVVKKWRGLRWKYWNIAIVPPKKYKSPSNEEINKIMVRLGICIRPSKLPPDNRACVLCHESGDGYTNGPARLLNMDVDKWVHLNCALWSGEVYETVNGALMNVEVALKRGTTLECVACHMKGATLGCFKIRCTNIYHFGCAFNEKCMFFKDKTMLCPLHIPKLLPPEMKDNELSSLSVFRRVYINREETRQVACIMHQGDQKFLLRVGSLIFLNIGQLLPHQLQAFHTPNCIFPVGYKITRMYWSMRMLGKRCQYHCSINDRDGKPEFKIQVREPGHEDIILSDATAKGVWQQVLEPIEKMRKEAKTIKVFSAFITGEDLFGLTEPSVLRVLESLPGVETLNDYNFKYGRSPLLELPLAINPTGCARSEPKLRTHFKRPHTLHTSSSSRSSFQTTITGLEVACPYTKQFVHSKSSQYRRMKTEWRNNVYLARSRIQGLGLYAARDLEKHTMVIEYIGQLIRNEVAETRERMYEAQNRGIYMFRVDDGRVIDATLCGGLARYINHSCNPNCVAEVVQIDRDNRIIIFANRRLSRGEELSYDYKFDIEDDQHKIPCLCGAVNCRKWMN